MGQNMALVATETLPRIAQYCTLHSRWGTLIGFDHGMIYTATQLTSRYALN